MGVCLCAMQNEKMTSFGESDHPAPLSETPHVNYSAVLVLCEPGRLADVRRLAEALPWFEAHQEDAEHHRFIGVIESSDTDQQVEYFRILQTMDGVRDVSLVVHRFESSTDDAES